MIFWFYKKVVGISLSDRTIEMVEVVKRGRRLVITDYNRIWLPPQVVNNGLITNQPELVKLIKQVFKTKYLSRASNIRVCLPETKTYVLTFKVPAISVSNDYQSTIAQELSRLIPVPINDLSWHYFNPTKDSSLVTVLAASNNTISEWSKVFNQAGFKVKTFDAELLATFRGLHPDGIKESVIIVDIGSLGTTVSAFSEQGLLYTYTFSVGGELITKIMATKMNISLKQAEQAKRQLGLPDPDDPAFTMILSGLEPLRDGLKSALNYFKEIGQIQSAKIIIVGGGSLLKGLPRYLEDNLNQPIFVGRLNGNDFNFKARQEDQTIYLTALGAAVGGLEQDSFGGRLYLDSKIVNK